MKRPIALVILDGWGYKKELEYNAIAQAHPAFFMYLLERYQHSFLQASGTAVGLLEGMPGNSRVGHFTIGVGKVIEQPITFLTRSYKENVLYTDAYLHNRCAALYKNHKRLHIVGLLSDGAVHGMEDHFYPWIFYALSHDLEVVLHIILDGRDVAPQSAALYLEKLDAFLQDKPSVCIGSLHGRFYAMDRDCVWSRTLLSYQVITQQQVHESIVWQDALQRSYAMGIFDEFFIPLQLSSHAAMQEGDALVVLLLRADRARQLVSLLLNKCLSKDHTTVQQCCLIPEHSKVYVSWCCTAVDYHASFNAYVLYQQDYNGPTLLDALAERDKTLFSIAETEKYAHITYFFNGGKEIRRACEQRILIQSKDNASYADSPEMCAKEITDAVVRSLQLAPCDFYLINYANADMVGHSGDFTATLHAVKYLDKQIECLVQEIVNQRNGAVFLTADHGKAEEMFDLVTQQIKTAHTTSLVPFISIHNDSFTHTMPHSLSDIMAYILAYIDFLDAL